MSKRYPVTRWVGGVIIGAGAVVAKDVYEYAVIAGNPARIIRYRKAESSN